MNDQLVTYGCLFISAFLLGWRGWLFARRNWPGGRAIILTHTPTGRLIVMPPKYEPKGIDEMLQALKGLPPLDSAEYTWEYGPR